MGKVYSASYEVSLKENKGAFVIAGDRTIYMWNVRSTNTEVNLW